MKFSELKARCKSKIATAQFFTRKYLPYHPGDLCMFGTVRELLDFFSAPLSDVTLAASTTLCNQAMSSTLEETARKGLTPEIYLMKHYLKKKGHRLTYTLSNSYQLLKKYFTILPQSEFKMVWFKAPNIKVATDDRLSSCYDDLSQAPTPKDITYYTMKDAFC